MYVVVHNTHCGLAIAEMIYPCFCCPSLALDEASISALGLSELAEDQLWVDTLLRFRLLALDSTGLHTFLLLSDYCEVICIIPTYVVICVCVY